MRVSSRRRDQRRLICGFLVRIIAALLLLRPLPSGAEPVPVFVSILPQKYFVEQVGTPRVAVTVMVGPGQSPATYEPTPRQLTALSGAQVYFSIGVAFEDAWMHRIRAANPKLHIVPTQRGIALLPLRGPDGQPLGWDPHVWTSPPLVKTIAANIRDALIEADPAYRANYEANYQRLESALDDLDREIQRILMPAKGKALLVFHPAWGYFADTYGLRQIPIEIAGKEPGAKSLARSIELGRREQAKVIFVQTQFSRRTAATVAAAIGARIVAVDPLAGDYPANLLRTARDVAAALQ